MSEAEELKRSCAFLLLFQLRVGETEVGVARGEVQRHPIWKIQKNW